MCRCKALMKKLRLCGPFAVSAAGISRTAPHRVVEIRQKERNDYARVDDHGSSVRKPKSFRGMSHLCYRFWVWSSSVRHRHRGLALISFVGSELSLVFVARVADELPVLRRRATRIRVGTRSVTAYLREE